MLTHRSKTAAVLTSLLAVPALAQTDATYLLVSSNTVSPTTPTTTIEVWTTWVDPGALFVFMAADYDLTAGDGIFSNPVNVLRGPGSSTGVIAGNIISGGRNGQLLNPIPPVWSHDNPILLATYDWTSTDFTPRTVDLRTENTSVFVVFRPLWGTVDLYAQEFTPGAGVINVIPAPAAWPLAALLLVSPGRRRRC